MGKGKDAIKMGMRNNFAYLAKSKYLICIAILVLSFNLSINMIEVIWKDQVHQLFPYAADYNVYMGKVLTSIGLLSTLFGVFICGQVIRKFGWSMGAYATPIVLLLTGMVFFTFLFMRDIPLIGIVSTFFGTTPLMMCAFFGSMQNCFSRASKFTFFDVTKEISFIPLSAECKLKGKAAIDGVGSRLGKSGGSLCYQFLLMFFGSISASAPFVGIIVLVAVVGWIWAVRAIGKQFSEVSTTPTAPDDLVEAPEETFTDQPVEAEAPSLVASEAAL